jgi:3-oxoacyl-[acyl-carrier-protein] synthase II
VQARRVVVTGLGVICPVGDGPAVFFENLLNVQSGIKRVSADFVDQLSCKISAPVENFDPNLYFPKHKVNSMDRVAQLASYACQQALKDSAIDLSMQNLDRVGVYIGTGMGGAASIEEGYSKLFKEHASRLKPFTVLMAMNNAVSSQIALDYELTGPNSTYCAACSSSSVAIGEAFRQIQHGYADVMIAGGAEALLTFGTIKAWEALRTLAEEDADDIASSCKPFSLNRSGLVFG